MKTHRSIPVSRVASPIFVTCGMVQISVRRRTIVATSCICSGSDQGAADGAPRPDGCVLTDMTPPTLLMAVSQDQRVVSSIVGTAPSRDDTPAKAGVAGPWYTPGQQPQEKDDHGAR